MELNPLRHQKKKKVEAVNNSFSTGRYKEEFSPNFLLEHCVHSSSNLHAQQFRECSSTFYECPFPELRLHNFNDAFQ